MKNLIIALSLFFALGANAQTKKAAVKKQVVTEKVSNEAAAQKNITALAAFTPLKPEMQNMLLELFTTKFRMLNDGTEVTLERKNYVSEVVTRKLEATLDAATFEKIKANKALFQSLTN